MAHRVWRDEATLLVVLVHSDRHRRLATISRAGREGVHAAMNVAARGATLSCAARGRGPACLVLCSIGTAPFDRQMPPQLGERLTLVFVDLRGSGRSTGEAADLSFDGLAEDLEAVRACLGVDQVAVLGHSILGALAIEYGRRRPDAVSHVIAVGTPPVGDMARVAAASEAFFERDASEERKRILRGNMAALPPDASPGQVMLAQTPKRFFDPRFDAASLFVGADVRRPFLAHLMGPLTSGWDVSAGRTPLRVPVLLAQGRYDYTVPHTLWDDVAPRLPTVARHIFERSGHQPFVEEPEEFASIVTGWLTGRCQGEPLARWR